MNTDTSVRMLQTVAMTVGTALLLWSVGVPTIFRHVEAASITSASDTLSNSAPGVVSNHTIVFTTPNGIAADETITITFDALFDTSSIVFTDVDIASSTDGVIINNPSSGAGTWGFSISGDTITLQAPDGHVAASSTTYTIEIGTNATFGASGANQIVNPSATTSYPIDIGGTMPDSGQVRVAIVDQVLVTASVDTSLTFTVEGVDANVDIDTATNTSATSTATTLPFGTLEVDESKVLAQRLLVSTNAANGYSVTVEQTGNLQSSTGADIDSFIDGGYDDTPSAWVAPSASIADENTYGHWGITSNDDVDFSVTPDRWVAASTTPRVVLSHDDPSNGTTPGEGEAYIGYQVQITALQEAGDDYNTTLRYIATPVF